MFKKISFLFFLLLLLILPYFVFAQTPLSTLEDTREGAGFAEANEGTVSAIAGGAVSTVLSLLGVAFIILIIYGGIRWMTAQGNEQEVETAKNILKNSVIGLIIVTSAYAIYALISTFILGGSAG